MDISEIMCVDLCMCAFHKFYVFCKDHTLPGKNEVIQCKSQDQIHEYSNSMDVKGATELLSSMARI